MLERTFHDTDRCNADPTLAADEECIMSEDKKHGYIAKARVEVGIKSES